VRCAELASLKSARRPPCAAHPRWNRAAAADPPAGAPAQRAATDRPRVWGRTPPARAAGGAVKFWDASAIVPLLVAEKATRSVQALARRDPDMLAWWGSQVECASALARLEREALLDRKDAAVAFDRLRRLADGWHEIEPSERVCENAARFVRVHALRAADAFSLRRPLSRPKDVPRRSTWSRSTTASRKRRGRKASNWLKRATTRPSFPRRPGGDHDCGRPGLERRPRLS
jgi:uncharacterized protein